jgi:hypothetical protein
MVAALRLEIETANEVVRLSHVMPGRSENKNKNATKTGKR